MNKRILISLLLLMIAAVLSATSFLILMNRFSALGEALENAIYARFPLQQACVQIETAWNKCAQVSQIFLLHSDLTELRAALDSLPDLTEEPSVFRNTCIRSLCLLEGIRDALYPTIENIL